MAVPEVVLTDPEAGGLDAMLAGLLSAAITDPAKAALLARMRGTVTITVPDAEVAVGLRFADGRCEVSPHGIAGSSLQLTLDSERLLALSSVPLLAGLPSLLTGQGRAVTRDLLLGRVRVGGFWHVGLLRGLTELLSTA